MKNFKTQMWYSCFQDFPCAEVLKSSSDLLLCDDRCKEIKNKKTQAELEKIEMKKSEEIKLQQVCVSKTKLLFETIRAYFC